MHEAILAHARAVRASSVGRRRIGSRRRARLRLAPPAHRRRELAHDRETEAGADRPPRRLPHRVEPLEHVRDVWSAGMPGPSSTTTIATCPSSCGAAYTSTCAVAYFSAFSTRFATIWREAFGIEVDREHAPADDLQVDAEVARLRREGLGRVADDLASRRTVAASSENWRLSSRERSSRSRTSRSSRRPSAPMIVAARLRSVGIGVVERAVGERLRVPADRREGRAQIVRDREQERVLAAACLLELRRHRVQRVGERGELVVGAGETRRRAPRGRRSRVASRRVRSRGSGGSVGSPARSTTCRRRRARSDRRAASAGARREAPSVSTRSVAMTTSTSWRTRVAVGIARNTVLPRRPLTSSPASSAVGLDVGRS